MKIFHQGDVFHGFTVTRVRESEELSGTLTEMTFEKTGTELCWFQGGDENMLFDATFKTPPEDSTGVTHILEHSVLCGSEKYPVKEPFTDLMKSSQSTFLNAMTFPDKTMYPVSSLNKQDFLNLMSVYLDAVFAPAILTNSNILRQEGWHIELDDEGNPSYKGVVFNEMKGALSDEGEIAENAIDAALFPDTCYRFVSGGDPEAIPSLTYDSFCQTYRRFYHPSNCRIWLDGPVPCEETFALIERYLTRFSKRCDLPQCDLPQISLQEKKPHFTCECSYDLPKTDEPEGKTHLYWSKILWDYTHTTESAAGLLLCRYLSSSNESPVRKRLIDRGVCQNVKMDFSSDLMQAKVTIKLENVADDKLDTAEKELFDAISAAIDEGIDKDEIDSILSKFEFDQRTQEEPVGLMRAISGMTFWLFGGDPLKGIECNPLFRELREKNGTGYFEEMAREIFLDDFGSVTLRMNPSHTYSDEKRQAENDRLREIAKGWSQGDRENIRREMAELTAWQQTPDSPEAAATIPHLERGDINPAIKTVPTCVEQEGGATFIRCTLPTNGVTYLQLSFPCPDITLEETAYVSLGLQIMGDLPTSAHTAREIQRLCNDFIGQKMVTIAPGRKWDGDRLDCTENVTVALDVLDEKVEKAIELMAEVLFTADYTREDVILPALKQVLDAKKYVFPEMGHINGQVRSSAHFDIAAAFTEYTSGFENLQILKRMLDNFSDPDIGWKKLAAVMNKLRKKYLVSCCMTAAACTSSGNFDFTHLLALLEKGAPIEKAVPQLPQLPLHEAIIVPSQVCYDCMSYNSQLLGVQDMETVAFAGTMLNSDYLWSKVRVQGGAYGVGARLTNRGSFSVSSYRDPAVAPTLAAYRGMGEYLRNFVTTGASIDKYMVSFMAEALMTPKERFSGAVTRVKSGITDEMRQQQRDKYLALETADMLPWCDKLTEFTEKAAICVIGFREAVDACPEENFTIYEM